MSNRTMPNEETRNSFNPDQLLIARNLLELTQGELAGSLGINQGHLSRIENRISLPDESLVAKMADRLKVPREFFFEPYRMTGGPMSLHAMFRKRASVTKRSIDRVCADFNVRLQHIRKLLGAVDAKSDLKIPRYDIEEGNGTPEEIAEKVRRAWLLPSGPIRNLVETAEAAGIFVVVMPIGDAEVDGATLALSGLPPVVFLNADRPSDRMRFSLAHEIGHLVMHSQPNDTMEEEANAFASAFLMPAAEFRASIARRISLAELARLKSIWRVAMQAALYRAQQLEILTKNQAVYLWKQISAAGYRKAEPEYTRLAPETPANLKGLVTMHLHELGYSVEQLSKMLCCHPDTVRSMYGLAEREVPKLRLIK